MSSKKFRLPNDLRDRVILVFSESGLTQAAFAEQMGISAAQFSELRSGKSRPSMELIFGMANHIRDIDLRWLLTGEGEMKVSHRPERDGAALGALIERVRRIWNSGNKEAIGKVMDVVGFWASKLEDFEEVMPRKLG
jgi:transcriptional regulator with XRE-family HTH domain